MTLYSDMWKTRMKSDSGLNLDLHSEEDSENDSEDELEDGKF